MASNRESSFGARLLRAQQLGSYISNFQNYAPPRMEESVSGYSELLNQIVLVNTEEAQLRQQYNTAVTNRINAFRKDEASVIKILPLIRGQILAQYGKNSIEFNQIDRIITNIRDTRITIKPATESTPELKISQSEQSYGSLTQYFNELVTNLAQLPGYSPSNPALQIAQLHDFAAQINQMNIEAALRFQLLRDSRNRRRTNYKELKERTLRIKSYSKANYGINASEYTLIKGLQI